MQVAIEDVVAGSGEATVSGPVVSVFRGPHNLLGTRVRLSVACVERAEEADWSPDGIGRFPIGSVRTGRVLEALVNDTPSGPEIALGLCAVVEAASTTPHLPLDFNPAAALGRNFTVAVLAVVLTALSLAVLAYVWF